MTSKKWKSVPGEGAASAKALGWGSSWFIWGPCGGSYSWDVAYGAGGYPSLLPVTLRLPTQLSAMTLSARPNILPTFSPRPYVLNFLLFAALEERWQDGKTVLNLLSSFMPLDPAIREETTQESLRPSGLMHEEQGQGLPWQARSPRSCPQACN